MTVIPVLNVPVVAPRVFSGDANPVAVEDFTTFFQALGLADNAQALLPPAAEDAVVLPEESIAEAEVEAQEVSVDDLILPLLQIVPKGVALGPEMTEAANPPPDLIPVAEEVAFARLIHAEQESLSLQSGAFTENRAEIALHFGPPASPPPTPNKLPHLNRNFVGAVADGSDQVSLAHVKDPQDNMPLVTAFAEPDLRSPPAASSAPPAAQGPFGNALLPQLPDVPLANSPPTHAPVTTDGVDFTNMAGGLDAVDLVRVEAGRSLHLTQDRVGLVTKISQQIRDGAEKATEIRLDPPELGRLRFIVSGGEQGLHLLIQADRPETAELLRRHLDLLGQDLRQAGYSGVDVSVGGGGQQHARDPAPNHDPAQSAVTSVMILDHRPAPQGASGLDLRL